LQIDLGLPLDEALASAKEELERTGVDVSCFATTLEQRSALEGVKALLASPTLMDHVPELLAACRASPPCVAHIRRAHPSLLARLIERGTDDALLLVSALASPIVHKDNLAGLVAVLQRSKADACGAALQAAQACMVKDEMAKRALFTAGFAVELVRVLDDAGEPAVALQACRCVRVLLSDDDRREGVHPETFARARQLGESARTGLLHALIRRLGAAVATDGDAAETVCAALKALVVNDAICQNAVDLGALPLALRALDATPEPIQATALLRYLSRNDDCKRSLGLGNGVQAMCALVQSRDASPELAREVAAALGVVCLRQTAVCDRLVLELDAAALLVGMMVDYAAHAEVQRACLVTVRNLVSNHANAALGPVFVQLGVEERAHAAAAAHAATCREAARDCMRDLKLRYADL